jgi:membrane-bound lytic murein transglycosylase F
MHIFSRFLLCGLVWLLCACSNDKPFANLQEGDELVVLTRNTPTTYYFDGDQPTGFDYDLISAYAQSRGLTVRVKVAFTLAELLDELEQGQAHLAAAGLTLTDERTERFYATKPYLSQRPLVIYKSGNYRPRSLAELANHDIVVLAGSSHNETLTALQSNYPELSWREVQAADTLELMQQLSTGRAELAIIDSLEFRIQQRLFPRLVKALELRDTVDMVWYLPKQTGAKKLRDDLNAFLEEAKETGLLDRTQERHFGSLDYATRMGTFTFTRKMTTDLPKWQSLITDVASEYQMDWRLLAAVAYQESHWNPKAKSPTGVRGMMMLTLRTAKELGIKNRLDARSSLRGGARFLKELNRRLPERIPEPDRTWMALAAYNIGMGHLEDARRLTQGRGGNPDSWTDVREFLPELQNPEVYRHTRFGFARGQEAQTYVDNIQHYYDILKLHDVPDNRIAPPIDMTALLPEAFRFIPRAL